MIIYAYYGLGKTTLCKKNPDLFIDVDEEYVMPKFNQNLDAVKDYILEISKHHIVLINGRLFQIPEIKVDFAFIPANKQMILNRLENRHTSQGFIDFVKYTFDENVFAVKTECEHVITLSPNDYLSNYRYLFI